MSERKPLGGHAEQKAMDVIAKEEKANQSPTPATGQNDSVFDEPTQKLEGMVTVMMLLENGNVANAVVLKGLMGDDTLCKIAERNIKVHFEADNSFAKCFNSADIIKRIQTIIQQNIILNKLNWSQISLTNSGGESLLEVKSDLGLEPIAIELIKDLEKNVTKGKLFVKSSDSYKKITSKYGLKEAVDRWLEPLP